jgi:hypothetical protein
MATFKKANVVIFVLSFTLLVVVVAGVLDLDCLLLIVRLGVVVGDPLVDGSMGLANACAMKRLLFSSESIMWFVIVFVAVFSN